MKCNCLIVFETLDKWEIGHVMYEFSEERSRYTCCIVNYNCYNLESGWVF